MVNAFSKKVLILGVNGFIGSTLAERLLKDYQYSVYGVDLSSDRIEHLKDRPGFYFHKIDITTNHKAIDNLVIACDIVIPLIAIATPADYINRPLEVFALNFEENLRIVRQCVKRRKRLIFPSSSEVYGMSEDEEYDEDSTNLVQGPISKQRWIYSCSKQLLDRVIWAYGQQAGARFTLFRPFNWIGPRLDSLELARSGRSRAITRMILSLVEGLPIQLVDGGGQKRCFTDVLDGVECLYRIIEDRDYVCNSRIINIGNPDNEISIIGLAEVLTDQFEKHPLRNKFPVFAGFNTVRGEDHYGVGYQDIQHRKPCVKTAEQLLGWRPKEELEQSIWRTLDFFLHESLEARDQC